jgi:Fe2+ transport system protein FeoA
MITEAGECLSDLPLGQKARVLSFHLPAEQHQRLLEMGLTVGAQCEIIRFAPLGDPIDIKVRGYHLSLRKKEASGVRVARV